MEIKDCFTIIIPSLALSIALYTFLSNNPKFREFGSKFWITVMLQLLAAVCCSLRLAVVSINESLKKHVVSEKFYGIIDNVLLYLFLLVFIASWMYLCKVFYIIYGSLYHLRKRRFLKYTKPIAWIYEKFFHKRFYEKNYRKRQNINWNSFVGICEANLNSVSDGGTILILYDNHRDYLDFLMQYIVDIIETNETVDYVTTSRNPIDICRIIPEDKLVNITKKLSIIDCFSPYYAFDDKIIKIEKEEWKQKGCKFYQAGSFAEIHSATNSSWYRFRKVCKNEENSYRIPHRTVYDTMSSLIRFSSEELYFLFLRHVVSSEKSYGMISTVLEPITIREEIKNELIQMSDIVIAIENGLMKLKKG